MTSASGSFGRPATRLKAVPHKGFPSLCGSANLAWNRREEDLGICRTPTAPPLEAAREKGLGLARNLRSQAALAARYPSAVNARINLNTKPSDARPSSESQAREASKHENSSTRFGEEPIKKTHRTTYLESIMHAGREIFEAAKEDAIVTVYSHATPSCVTVRSFDGRSVHDIRRVSKADVPAPFAYDWVFSEHVEFLAKLRRKCGWLSEIIIGTCENACATSDAYKLKEHVEESSATYDRSAAVLPNCKYWNNWKICLTFAGHGR
jgi:hypothetical protein